MWHVLNREGGYDEWPDVAVGITHSLAQLEVIDKVHPRPLAMPRRPLHLRSTL